VIFGTVYACCSELDRTLKKTNQRGMKMKLLRTLTVGAALALSAMSVQAGPLIIAGTDADDHGSVSGGVNQTGWEFMQSSITNIANAVSNGNRVAVCIGCNGSTATAAFNSAFNLSNLAGWTSTSLTSVAAITSFFDGTGAVNINNAGMIYMPTVTSNVTGGITDAQLAVVNANGATINNFLSTGGGLFTQDQANSTIGYGWLTSLLPGLNVRGDNVGGVANTSTLQLTADGQAQFPTLTNADLSNATPWHAYFTGTFGALQSLVVGNGDGVGGFNDTVVLGGGFAGGGGVIVCGTPGAPDCPPSTNVPLAPSLPLVALGLFGLMAMRRKA
jgi:hypothetical protein